MKFFLISWMYILLFQHGLSTLPPLASQFMPDDIDMKYLQVICREKVSQSEIDTGFNSYKALPKYEMFPELAYLNAAKYCIDQKQYYRSTSFLQKSLELKSSSVEAHMLLGQISKLFVRYSSGYVF